MKLSIAPVVNNNDFYGMIKTINIKPKWIFYYKIIYPFYEVIVMLPFESPMYIFLLKIVKLIGLILFLFILIFVNY